MKDKINIAIDKTLEDARILKEHSKTSFYVKPIEDLEFVLNLLKEEIIKSKPNYRVLRAMHDIGMSSYKDFENTVIETDIYNLNKLLGLHIPGFKELRPLRNDFKHGDPV
jgi:hypothetical protein